MKVWWRHHQRKPRRPLQELDELIVDLYLRHADQRELVLHGVPMPECSRLIPSLPAEACVWRNEDICGHIWMWRRIRLAAFAMALHPRLGARSGARVLDDEILGIVSAMGACSLRLSDEDGPFLGARRRRRRRVYSGDESV